MFKTEYWLSNKIQFVAIFGIAFAAITHFIETYLFNDWQFLKFLLVLIVIDTLLGLVIAHHKHEISSQRFAKLFQKIVLYLLFLVLTHVLCHFTVEGSRNSLFSWLSSLAYSAIMVREGISIIENLTTLNPSLLPHWLINRLKSFDKTGKIE